MLIREPLGIVFQELLGLWIVQLVVIGHLSLLWLST